jgi:hypothetical protein
VETDPAPAPEGHDPSCTPLVFPAGTGAVEAGTSTHIHMVRNETNSIAQAVVTYMVPVGTPRTKLVADRSPKSGKLPVLNCCRPALKAVVAEPL